MMLQDRLTVESHVRFFEKVQVWFEDFCFKYLPQHGWPNCQRSYRNLNLALAESFTNVVRHAHRDLPPETPIEIEVTLWINDRLEIKIWDYGKPFDPGTIPEPEPGTLQVGGYGWYLIRRSVDYFIYERSPDNRNCLRIGEFYQKSNTKS
jgi:serine/threonine-protein kinase RsbW